MKNISTFLVSMVSVLAFSCLANAEAPNLAQVSLRAFSPYIQFLEQNSRQPADLSKLQAIYLFLNDDFRLPIAEGAYTRLAQMAKQQSTAWLDGLSKAGVQVSGPIRLDAVEGLYAGATLLGLRMTYSEVVTNSAAQVGRVSEAAFVSADFKQFFVDPNARAQLIF
jgi:hypothetical protein